MADLRFFLVQLPSAHLWAGGEADCPRDKEESQSQSNGFCFHVSIEPGIGLAVNAFSEITAHTAVICSSGPAFTGFLGS